MPFSFKELQIKIVFRWIIIQEKKSALFQIKDYFNVDRIKFF